jgi:hypothetical protein
MGPGTRGPVLTRTVRPTPILVGRRRGYDQDGVGRWTRWLDTQNEADGLRSAPYTGAVASMRNLRLTAEASPASLSI